MRGDQRRNLNPHAEARLAMALWGAEYAAQSGGSMDFWDSQPDSRKALCTRLLNDILIAMRSAGRAEPPLTELSRTALDSVKETR